MQRACRNPAAVQLVDLILHQRDQRRHDERGAREHYRGQLVSERFSGTRRHDGKDVAAAEDRADDLFLSFAEAGVAEVAAKRRQRLGGCTPDVHETTMSSSPGSFKEAVFAYRRDPISA